MGFKKHFLYSRVGNRYNGDLATLPRRSFMEAENINLIASRIDDLGQRAGQLRRYL